MGALKFLELPTEFSLVGANLPLGLAQDTESPALSTATRTPAPRTLPASGAILC